MSESASGGPDLIAVGNCCVDIFLPPHEPPPRGGLTRIPSLDVVPGGNGLNTAVAAARLGVRAAVAGVLGDDLFGRHLRDVLDAEGVDTRLLDLLPGRQSPATVVLNDETGERSFVHHAGTNDDFRLPPATLDRPPRVLHLAAPEVLGGFWPEECLAAARRARELGATVTLDAFADRGGPDVVAAHRPVIELCEVALPNEEEALHVTGAASVDAAIDALHDAGVAIVAIKRGERGAIVSHDGRRVDVPTERVDAVDTCGAGDNFAGGFLAAFLEGRSPVECARIGCGMGTRCVQFRGSLTGTADPRFLARTRSLLGGGASR